MIFTSSTSALEIRTVGDLHVVREETVHNICVLKEISEGGGSLVLYNFLD